MMRTRHAFMPFCLLDHATRWKRLLSAMLVALTLAPGVPLFAQDEDEPVELIEREPFDRITLDARNDDTVYEIVPLDLSDGDAARLPNSRGTGKLIFRRLDQRSLRYEVPWEHVVKLERYQDMLLAEAEKFRDALKLDDAFRYYSRLLRDYKTLDKLKSSVEVFLYTDAIQLFKAGRNSESLAVLEGLQAKNGNFRTGQVTIDEAIQTTLRRLLEQYYQEKKYFTLHAFLDRISKTQGDKQKALVEQYWKQLSDDAEEQRDAAKRYLADGDARRARVAVRSMTNIYPKAEGVRELEAEILLKFPMVIVAVDQLSKEPDPRRLDNWAERRVGYLSRRLLLEFFDRGEEGGTYISPFGAFELINDGATLRLDLNPSAAASRAADVKTYHVADRMLSLTEPANQLEFSPGWNRLVDAVRIAGSNRVEVDLRFPFVLPEAFLQIPVVDPTQSKPVPDGLFVEANDSKRKRTKTEVNYVSNPKIDPDGKKKLSIVEQQFTGGQVAVTSLVQGEIDVIDRVFPASIPRLQEDARFHVVPYSLPTVHMIVPNPRTPFLKQAAYRRALTYGINRELILHSILLANQEVPGSRVISGPFPAGVSETDVFAYAYDEKVHPLPYEPLLAMTMIELVNKQLAKAAKDRKEAAPQQQPLLLAHPTGDIPRIACKAIVQQLKAVGVECITVELPPGVTDDPDDQFDLLYIEMNMWEPLTDARRLFNDKRIMKQSNVYVELALSQLERSRNWSQARRRLYEIHTVAASEALVIPLWQIVDHAAYRRNLVGVGDQPLSLYQNVGQWRLVPLSVGDGS